MSARRPICLVVALGVAGCSTVPALPDEPRVTLDEIITTVECEVSQAMFYVQDEYRREGGDPEEHWLNDWAAKVNFDLKTEITSSASPTLAIATPLDPGLLTVSLGGGRKDENEAFGKFEYSFNLAALTVCNPPKTRSLLTGNVGVRDWLSRVGRAMDATGNQPKSINHDAEFIITIGADGEVTVAGLSLGDGTIGGGLKGSGERKDTHKLALTLAPIPAEDLPKVQGPVPVRDVGPATERRLDEEDDERRVEDLEDALEEEVDDCRGFGLLCLR